jgi:hypothetical protein
VIVTPFAQTKKPPTTAIVLFNRQLVADTAEIFKVHGDLTIMRLLTVLTLHRMCVFDLSAVLSVSSLRYLISFAC